MQLRNDEATVEMLGIKDERDELLAKAWWNLAIETAAKELNTYKDICMAGDRIRDLKK